MPSIAADGAFPTLGWTDATSYADTAGLEPTDFTRPVDPRLGEGSVTGLSFVEMVAGYDGSGGGAGIDLATVDLPAIRYVRISNVGVNSTPEVDAIADVAPGRPRPTSTATGGSTAATSAWCWPVGEPTDLVADLDGDGVVGGGDLGLVLAAWPG